MHVETDCRPKQTTLRDARSVPSPRLHTNSKRCAMKGKDYQSQGYTPMSIPHQQQQVHSSGGPQMRATEQVPIIIDQLRIVLRILKNTKARAQDMTCDATLCISPHDCGCSGWSNQS